jgi:hypothetical protein
MSVSLTASGQARHWTRTISIDGIAVRADRHYFRGEGRHHFENSPKVNHPDKAAKFTEIMSGKTETEGTS